MSNKNAAMTGTAEALAASARAILEESLARIQEQVAAAGEMKVWFIRTGLGTAYTVKIEGKRYLVVADNPLCLKAFAAGYLGPLDWSESQTTLAEAKKKAESKQVGIAFAEPDGTVWTWGDEE